MATSLEVINLQKSYDGKKDVLKNVNFTVTGNNITAIIGPSGTGKSTLLRCINRLIYPTKGHIYLVTKGDNKLDLTTVKGKALRHARREISMVFQEYNLVERLTVMENLLTGRLGYISMFKAWRRKFSPEDIQRAYALLDKVGLKGFESQLASALSGGQRQRVGIARALMQNPKILLADEPTSSLDPKTAVEIMKLIVDISEQEQIPVILNIHDVSLAKEYASRIIGMNHGSVVFDGSAQDLTDEDLLKIYGSKIKELDNEI
ncbi:phosphonate ABC transporter ATP-binding protein [Ignatzschineria sp. LJL83]